VSDPGLLVLIALTLLAAAFVKGTTGMGFPLIATPILALATDVQSAIGILLIPQITMDLLQMFRGGSPFRLMRRFASLLVCCVLGVFVGTELLFTVPAWVVTLAIGLMLIAFVVSNALRVQVRVSPRHELFLSPLVGVAGGILNGVTNAAGPVMALYLFGLGLEKRDYVRALTSILLTEKVSQLIAVSRWEALTASIVQISLAVTAFVMLGFYIGLKVVDRVDQRLFNRAILVLLGTIGVLFTYRGLVVLM
jgi:uncharacterized membrane protein YfcA